MERGVALMIRLKLWLAAAGAFIAGLALIYAKGRSDEEQDNEIEEYNEYISTRRRMDEAAGPSDADVQRWLHERGQYKRDL